MLLINKWESEVNYIGFCRYIIVEGNGVKYFFYESEFVVFYGGDVFM